MSICNSIVKIMVVSRYQLTTCQSFGGSQLCKLYRMTYPTMKAMAAGTTPYTFKKAIASAPVVIVDDDDHDDHA